MKFYNVCIKLNDQKAVRYSVQANTKIMACVEYKLKFLNYLNKKVRTTETINEMLNFIRNKYILQTGQYSATNEELANYIIIKIGPILMECENQFTTMITNVNFW